MRTQNVIAADFKHRRSAHQTITDRRRLRPTGNTFGETTHLQRTLRTEFWGGWTLGFLVGSCIVGFFWLLTMWVDAGGAR